MTFAADSRRVRITESGEPITAQLVEPVYAGTTIAIPEGSTVKGHVSSISSASRHKGQLLRGDFTRPRTANVTFDSVILPDGTALPIHTDSTIGVSDVKTAKYLPKSQRPSIRQKMKDAAKPLSEPNKLQRLSQAAVTSLVQTFPSDRANEALAIRILPRGMRSGEGSLE
jgi:hypothetical protein